VKRQRVLGASLAVAVASCAASAAGCGGAVYVIQASSASARLEEAKEIGAEKHAPYEYYLAREHMTKASEEASQGDYSDAIDLAEIAEEAAEKAIKLTREAHRGAGR
jgi:hypothetical protein